ncbi:unnamed protein product [Phytomonas sp. EM1]|nr:unnamed protein product [Phytomonas sp. EM1]|eukprot:CCW62264.1 unnamed protein product [Phytomonas sp. isolate EM1]
MSKRARVADVEIFETFASLLRQSASRVVERFKLHRANNSASGLNRNANNRAPYSSGRLGSEWVGSRTPQSAGASTAPRATKPIDILVIQYCMYYLDLSGAPPNHYTRLAQEVLTASPERVLMSRFFTGVPLPVLCEGLIAEYPAEAIQAALKEIDEYVEVRALIGEWIDEHANDEEFDEIEEVIADSHAEVSKGPWKEEVNSDEEAGSTGLPNSHQGYMPKNVARAPVLLSTLGLASLLHRSLEFWVRIQNFMHAASLSSAKAHAFALHPRYESDLMQLLRRLTLPLSSGNFLSSPVRAAAPVARGFRSADLNDNPQVLEMETPSMEDGMKKSDEDGAEGGGIIPDRARFVYEPPGEPTEVERTRWGPFEGDPDLTSRRTPRRDDGVETHAQNVATTVLADTLALSHCPLPSPGPTPTPAGEGVLSAQASQRLKGGGVHPSFYTMVHARLSFMVARDRLQLFSRTMATNNPPPLTIAQRSLYEQQQQLQAQQAFGRPQDDQSLGVPLEYIPDDNYFRSLLEKHQEGPMDEDEEIYKDEVVDYYLRHPWPQQGGPPSSPTSATNTALRSGGRRQQPQGPPASPLNLVKPHRFCKVKTGFTWTQYNRTHYDARTNPPPRTVLWYEFTLFYPALANTKRDMRNIFHIENTPKGMDDDYCLLVFSVGPPYADVAYRIVRKQWDTRRGGVRISFDSTGRYKLFFRFTNSNYRR